ncbi:MAG TPA: glycosyltransferase [Pyrinomonadaceae bacterium]|jgi:glycosyltransferase involved in cell wall biosynthesis|nr:glycosyltransferase [Pyrinomonadaceae bacterium]
MSGNTKIIRIIARLNVGGPAKHVVWLTSGLKDSGFDTLLVTGKVPEGEEDMSYFAAEMGVIPHYFSEMSREISLNDAVTVWKLYRLFLRERPDIVHTHTAKAGTVGRTAGFLYRWLTPGVFIGKPRQCKFVHTYHGHVFHSYYGRGRTRLFLAVERLLARLVTDRLIVVSKQQSIEIGEKFRVGRSGQIKVIPLGLDLGLFADHASRRTKFRHELCIPDHTILIGIVGRLTEIKNHQMFLRVVARLKEIDPACWRQGAVRFIVIGDGGLRDGLEYQTEELGLEKDVIFVGSRKDPEYFYPALDVVALTSHNEGTPLTLIEAMANARPVVATSVGGVVDLLGDVVEDGPYQVCRRGIAVDAGDEEAFVSALSRIIRDRSLRQELGERGLEFVEVNYSKERLFEDIKDLYDELSHKEAQKAQMLTATRL